MHLLDVNLLLALVWNEHPSHSAAQRWFMASLIESFATCAMTESGLLRLLCNPIIIGAKVNTQEALEYLHNIQSMSGYNYWESPSPAEPVIHKEIIRAQGYRQIPDAYLIGLAKLKGGKLATLDAKLLDTFGSDGIEHVSG